MGETVLWPQNSFAFAPLHDSPPDRNNPLGHDATGKFHHGLDAWKRLYRRHGGQVTTLKFDNHRRQALRHQEIEAAMRGTPGLLDAVAYFGHGTPRSMSSAQYDMGHVAHLAAVVRARSTSGVVIALYACDCGAANGFAQALAGALADRQAVVFAHSVFGDSVTNPSVVRFPGGTPVCPPGRRDDWHRRLLTSNLWARFPFMTPDEIVADLDGHPAPPRDHARPRATHHA